MKLRQRSDPDRIFQQLMDTYGYLFGVVVLLAGFVLIGYLITQ
ncbi:MAG TPA: hypothetical protein VL092_10745 [Chitinophagaceae bacterium]|nr:hypothetical protein [Chitinophagaceae bacterium]